MPETWGDLAFERDLLEGNVPSEEVSVARAVEPVRPAVVRRQQWCLEGNACPFVDCRFKHERCTVYDGWIRAGRRGRQCRHIASDPTSCMSPSKGGCMYDHRDPTKLVSFVKTLPIEGEESLREKFGPKGLRHVESFQWDATTMTRVDKALLVRSMAAAGFTFEDEASIMTIVPKNKNLPAKTETELIESFGPMGLECYAGFSYDVSSMDHISKMLLVGSLKEAEVEFENNGSWMVISSTL